MLRRPPGWATRPLPPRPTPPARRPCIHAACSRFALDEPRDLDPSRLKLACSQSCWDAFARGAREARGAVAALPPAGAARPSPAARPAAPGGGIVPAPWTARPAVEAAGRWLGAAVPTRTARNVRRLYGAQGEAAEWAGSRAAEAMVLVHRAFEHAYTPGYIASWRRAGAYWCGFCERIATPPYPVVAQALVMFLCDRVVRLGLEPSGNAALLTALRSFVDIQRFGWGLDALDDRVLGMVQRGLAKDFKGQNARGAKEPFRLHHIETLLRRRDEGSWGPRQRQMLLQAQLAHGGMLRTAEHTAGKLLVGDVEFLVESDHGLTSTVSFRLGRADLVGVRLRLRNAKTGHAAAAPQTALIGRRHDELDVVGSLWDYFETHGLHAPEARQQPLFCEIGPSGARLSAHAVSGDSFRRGLAELLVAGGFPARDFGGHSPRRGGCNDLFDAGVPLEMVMKAGRWRSTAWMVYRELTPAAMRRMASAPPQRGLSPLGAYGPRLLT